MTQQARPQLTDARIERMLIERAGSGAPTDLTAAIATAVHATNQRAPGLLGAGRRPLAFSGVRLSPRLAAAAAIGVLAVGGALFLIQPHQPAVGGPSPTPDTSVGPSEPASPSPSPSTSVVPARAASWSATGSMITARRGFSVTLLRDGRVLVAGGDEVVEGIDTASAELYDPVSGTWTATGSMTIPRNGHTATLLRDGKVLVAGGGSQADQFTRLASTELYDPASGTWTATGSLAGTRSSGTATLLPDGKVLVAGGETDSIDFPGNAEGTASAELYDPATRTWTATASMLSQHFGHTATLLPDGNVLVAAGACCDASPDLVATAELYDPGTGTWTATGSMLKPRFGPGTTLLPDGTVLVTGGSPRDELSTAELYHPRTGVWTLIGTLVVPGAGPAATLLPTGKVLVAGGFDRHADEGWGSALGLAELYDPGTGTWTATASMLAPIGGDTATLLRDGRVLVFVEGGERYATAVELYDPGTGQ